MSNYNHTLYRSRHGKIFGVFQGMSDYAGLDAFWMRLFFIILVIFTGIFPLILVYIVAALMMKIEPLTPLEPQDEEFYNSMTSNHRLALQRLMERLDALDRRTQRIESTVTARGSDWDRRMGESL
jgi:phage shock protein C